VKTAATAFALLLSSLTLAAQNGAKPEGQVLVLRAEPAGSGCPVSMRASQGIWDHTIRVRQGQQEEVLQPFGQRILLTLGDPQPASIVAATLKVYGLTAKNHVVQADGNENANGDATKIMKIAFATREKNWVSTDLYIPGFTAVNSIELLDVSYDDGRVWRTGGSSVCRVTPDPMMLIANH
jgi:hypothetical protein